MTSSAKTCLMEKQTTSPYIGCFHTFKIVFMLKTAHGATKMFSVDVHEQQWVKALIRRRAKARCLTRASSFGPLKAGFSQMTSHINYNVCRPSCGPHFIHSLLIETKVTYYAWNRVGCQVTQRLPRNQAVWH